MAKMYVLEITEEQRTLLSKAVQGLLDDNAPTPRDWVLCLSDESKRNAEKLLSSLDTLVQSVAFDARHLSFVDGAGDVNLAWQNTIVFCLYERKDGSWTVHDIVHGGHPRTMPSINSALNWALGRLETHILPTLTKKG